ncbi:MAG: hypothetical protein ABF553_07480 [Acetobacter orientalis]|uniref:hypothetical protein n=1 Tax=Acetobacter orientalis TaxID=146474 RepID=UPI0039ECF746
MTDFLVVMIPLTIISIYWLYREMFGKRTPKGRPAKNTAIVPLLDMTGENANKFTKIPNLWPYPQSDDLYTCTPARVVQIKGENSGKKLYKVVLNTVAFAEVEGWPYVRGIGVGDLTCGKEGYLEWGDIKSLFDEETGKTYRTSNTISEYLRLSVGGLVDADFKKL